MNIRQFLISMLFAGITLISAGLDDQVFPGNSTHTVRELLACAELPVGEVLFLEELDVLSPENLLKAVTEKLLLNFTPKNSFVLQCLQFYTVVTKQRLRARRLPRRQLLFLV